MYTCKHTVLVRRMQKPAYTPHVPSTVKQAGTKFAPHLQNFGTRTVTAQLCSVPMPLRRKLRVLTRRVTIVSTNSYIRILWYEVVRVRGTCPYYTRSINTSYTKDKIKQCTILVRVDEITTWVEKWGTTLASLPLASRESTLQEARNC